MMIRVNVVVSYWTAEANDKENETAINLNKEILDTMWYCKQDKSTLKRPCSISLKAALILRKN